MALSLILGIVLIYISLITGQLGYYIYPGTSSFEKDVTDRCSSDSNHVVSIIFGGGIAMLGWISGISLTLTCLVCAIAGFFLLKNDKHVISLYHYLRHKCLIYN